MFSSMIRQHRGAKLFHAGQLILNEMPHAGILQTDGVDEPGRCLPQTLALVSVLALQRQPLAGDTAQLFHVHDARVLAAEAEGTGRGDDRAAQRFAAQGNVSQAHTARSLQTPAHPCRQTRRRFCSCRCSPDTRPRRRPSWPPCSHIRARPHADTFWPPFPS